MSVYPIINAKKADDALMAPDLSSSRASLEINKINKPDNSGISAVEDLDVHRTAMPSTIINNPMYLVNFLIIKRLVLTSKCTVYLFKRQIDLSFLEETTTLLPQHYNLYPKTISFLYL